MDFNRVPGSPEEVFRLIGKVASGRTILEAFFPSYTGRKVRIAPYALSLLERLRAALGDGQPVGACFINDGETGTIYFDPTSPIGVLAPFLVHEMVHSLDGSVWKAAREPLPRPARDRVFLAAESRAFECQHVFLRELKESYPGYAVFLAAQYPRAQVLHERMTDERIADLYGFKAS